MYDNLNKDVSVPFHRGWLRVGGHGGPGAGGKDDTLPIFDTGIGKAGTQDECKWAGESK